jgi:uncharacterized protein
MAGDLEMRFKINEIGDAGMALNLPVTAPWLAAECPDLEVRPGPGGIALAGQLLRTGDDLFLRGDLRGVLEMPCARCLETARLPLAIPLSVTFFDREQAEEDDDGAAPGGDDVDVAYYEGDEVDLGPEVRDQILLALPVSPLCSESCLGLCPVCGGNRNQAPCDCEARRQRMASPMAALAKLKV